MYNFSTLLLIKSNKAILFPLVNHRKKTGISFAWIFACFLVHPPIALAAAFQRQMHCLVLSIYRENTQADRKSDGVTIAGIILKLHICILLNDFFLF